MFSIMEEKFKNGTLVLLHALKTNSSRGLLAITKTII